MVANETLSGVGVSDGDVLLWDGTTVTVVLTEADFGSTSGGFDLNALAIPEPSLAVLAFAAAMAVIAVHSSRFPRTRRR